MFWSCLRLEQKLENWGCVYNEAQKEKHCALIFSEHQAMECLSLCLHAGCSWHLKANLVHFEPVMCKESWRFDTGNQR